MLYTLPLLLWRLRRRQLLHLTSTTASPTVAYDFTCYRVVQFLSPQSYTPKSCDCFKSDTFLSNPCFRAAVSFTDDEKEQLRKFTNRSYLLDKTSRYQVWLSLVDILLAYSYEVRSIEGEHTVSVSVCVYMYV